MYHRFQDRFGTAGVVIAVIALVAALGGSALAASGALTGKQKKEVEKIAKKYAGKPGAPGTNGTSGANGKDGTEGKEGPKGKDGTDGTPGAPGKSVTVTELEPEEQPECEETGGALVEAEGSGTPIEVCAGKEGSPWTDGGTLPQGATETGAWSLNASESSTIGESWAFVPISFTIPLAAGLDEDHVHFQGEAGFSDHCHSLNAEHPQADSGNLCVYTGLSEHLTFDVITSLAMSFNSQTNEAGAQIVFTVTGDNAGALGSWAVTG
jgi:hypothetical protein